MYMITEALTPEAETYPGFKHSASDLAAFIYARPFNAFTYALKNLGGIGIYKPDDDYSFLRWLKDHEIREIRYYD
jgi:hypothetical protein